MRVFLALLVGIGIGAAGLWYFGSSAGQARVQATSTQIQDAAKNTGQAIQDKLRVLDLRPQTIKDELARTGQVVRQTAQNTGKAVADATVDARITGAIKAKLFANRNLSALSISVNTTQGIVTLSGMVPSIEAISQAMLLAMDTEGVREVISTLQVKSQNGSA